MISCAIKKRRRKWLGGSNNEIVLDFATSKKDSNKNVSLAIDTSVLK